MQQYYEENKLEVGVDEVARGCLAGRVYAAAVIWPPDIEPEERHPLLKDSKKLSRKQRDSVKDYIENTAIDFAVSYESSESIDKNNILKASHMAMHNAIKNLNVEPESILADGHIFNAYYNEKNDLIPHKCFVGGDNKYSSIAAASILAKVYHDEYIDKLCDQNPDLEKYGWRSNMCYGTKEHMDAIKKYGISIYHRKTFGICKNFI
jgi:ribonuclease HII